MISLIIQIVVALIGVGLGYLIKEKKCYDLMSGYNSVSLEQRLELPVEQMAHDYGITLYIISAMLIVVGIVLYFTSNVVVRTIFFGTEVIIALILCEVLTIKYEFRPRIRKVAIVLSVVFDILIIAIVVGKLVL